MPPPHHHLPPHFVPSYLYLIGHCKQCNYSDLLLLSKNYDVMVIFRCSVYIPVLCFFPKLSSCFSARGRMNGGGDINALGLLPDKLKTELALHVNLDTLKKVGYNISKCWFIIFLYCLYLFHFFFFSL